MLPFPFCLCSFFLCLDLDFGFVFWALRFFSRRALFFVGTEEASPFLEFEGVKHTGRADRGLRWTERSPPHLLRPPFCSLGSDENIVAGLTGQ